MPRNYFRENRIAVQKAVIDLGFLKPLSSDDVPLIMIEHKAKQGSGKLREVIIEDIPVGKELSKKKKSEFLPKVWVLDLESEEPVIGKVINTKTTENALILMGNNALYILLLEMKETIKPYDKDGILGIRKKMEHSIGRISLLLSIYLFGSAYNDFPIVFKGIVFYNSKTDLETAIANDINLSREDICLHFKKKLPIISIKNPLGNKINMQIDFIENNSNDKESFLIDFNDLVDSEDLEDMQESNQTCPVLKSLPEF